MSNKIMVILMVVVLILVVFVGAGFFMMWNKLNAVGSQNVQGGTNSTTDEGSTQSMGPIFPLETFIVNLADPNGNRYLRVTMKLELKSDEETEQVERRLPQIRDGILMILPTKKYTDINSVEGKTVLRDQIMAGINNQLKKGSVTNIYFTEFVVQ